MFYINNMVKCPKGQIERKAYTRKAYTRADGTRVKAAKVAAGCVPDKGLPGKTPKSKKVLPKPTKGNLGKYGYYDVKNTKAAVRRAALTKAVKDAGYATIVRRVNLVANYNKNSDPRAHKLMRSDIAWMQKVLAPKYSKTSRKTSRKRSRKASRKVSRKRSRKTSRKTSRKLVKAGTKVVGGKKRQLYHVPGSTKKFYQYRKKTGGMGRRYV